MAPLDRSPAATSTASPSSSSSSSSGSSRRLSASAVPFYPARAAARRLSNYSAAEGSTSSSRPVEPSYPNVLPADRGHITITAPPSVDQAVQNRKDHTHFISLPLLAIRSGRHEDKLTSFLRNGHETSTKYFGSGKSVFARPETVHLTVLMLKLEDDRLINEAFLKLQSISTKVNEALENKPIFIKLRGLVYAPVSEGSEKERLERACKIIIEELQPLQSDVRQELKLHVTTMNVLFGDANQKRKGWFDAQEIFEKYGKEEWGEYLIGEVHLSQRKKFDSSGYYHCCSSIRLPAEIQAE